MSKQHGRMLQVERFGFGNNVAGFGNNVERNFVLSTKSKQIEHVQFVSALSKRRNFTINSFDIVAVLATESNVASTKSNVASTLLLVWTGLKARRFNFLAVPRSRNDLRQVVHTHVLVFVCCTLSTLDFGSTTKSERE